MRLLQQCVATAAFLAATSIFINRCAAQSVIDKTYATSDGDLMKFFSNGIVVEANGAFGVVYPGQEVFMGQDGRSPRTQCTYKQNDDKIVLTCPHVEPTTFTVNKDGTLTGPPEGLWQHAAFAHLVPKK